MSEYEDVSIELGELKRELTKNKGEIVVLLELLRRCGSAMAHLEEYHSEDYSILEEVKDELSLWKTERVA